MMERKGTATVVKSAGTHYLLSELPVWNPFRAEIRGKLRLETQTETNPVAVGDLVEYAADAGNFGSVALISKILPRRNCVIRKSANLSYESHVIAANVDAAYLVVTLYYPEIKPEFVDRFLVSCEAYGVPAIILLNKNDLIDEGPAQLGTDREAFESIYRRAGYRVEELSAIEGRGIAKLRREIRGRVVLLSGISGVGKSSIVKALDPKLEPKVNEISSYYRQGKHTTSMYEMYPVSTGGFVIDTPGVRGFGLVNFKPEELSTYFPEMLEVMDGCRFKPCTHTHEPDCAVKAAVGDGRISVERYNSYLGMLDEGSKYR
ncbi:MAG: ribosome small subunit-dependent GTPase A [Bacteroidales bacterium]|jgi:ribosome biogenesis GTPase|nr:ribosome small subunit-dependent GTPase A [Bacteroidales bacterium]MCI2122102.1 ribosome small subunit-dependent GTPase A [Bacteroidales bacterium]MCI2146333.1 ribosome small subunit-dependent GTPase A [Bacteroidales bacterium]